MKVTQHLRKVAVKKIQKTVRFFTYSSRKALNGEVEGKIWKFTKL